MIIVHDPDEWETVSDSRPCSYCAAGTPHYTCNGSFGIGQRRRDPAEVARIKAERERKREDEVLAEARRILERRQALAAHLAETDRSW